MPIQNVLMNAGTWLNASNDSNRFDGDSYMNVGRVGYQEAYEARPLINFANDGFSGQILSASLRIYSLAADNGMWVTGYKVNRAFNIASTWRDPWTTPGCNAITEDRSNVALLTSTRLAAGWNTLPVADLTELLAVIDGNDTILLVGDNHTAVGIDKANVPYLAIEYKTSIVGGIQIF